MKNIQEMTCKNNIVDLAKETIPSSVASTTDEMPVRPHGNRRCSLSVVWPEGPFTVHDAQALNPKVIHITLRFRLNRALENGSVKLVGKRPVPFGRPRLVFVKKAATSEVLDAAIRKGGQGECFADVEPVAA